MKFVAPAALNRMNNAQMLLSMDIDETRRRQLPNMHVQRCGFEFRADAER